MAELGVMIEAQDGLDWDLWRQTACDADRLGFASLRTSDHCFSVFGVTDRHSLPAWPALALAAEWTTGIQLGPMVSPMTFYEPAILARFARAVDELAARVAEIRAYERGGVAGPLRQLIESCVDECLERGTSGGRGGEGDA